MPNEQDSLNHVGAWLRAEREARGLSLEEMARLVGSKRMWKTVPNIEAVEANWRYYPSLSFRIAKLLGLDKQKLRELAKIEDEERQAAWIAWTDQPSDEPLVAHVKVIPGVWISKELRSRDPEEALKEALAWRRSPTMVMVVELSRRHRVTVFPNGRQERWEAKPDNFWLPVQMIGGQTFRFYADSEGAAQ